MNWGIQPPPPTPTAIPTLWWAYTVHQSVRRKA